MKNSPKAAGIERTTSTTSDEAIEERAIAERAARAVGDLSDDFYRFDSYLIFAGR